VVGGVRVGMGVVKQLGWGGHGHWVWVWVREWDGVIGVLY
jgi:hypothetical protein